MKQETSLIQDLSRGLHGKCPHCNEGRIFGKWLKINDTCPVCQEEFHHHRADDFPAYIVIAIVGHIMVTFALTLEDHFSPPYWVHMVLTLPMTLILAMLLLQPVKGAVVAIQWRIGMHGFKESKENRKNA